VPLCVAAQTLMQGIGNGNVLYLKIRHSMNMACYEPAVKILPTSRVGHAPAGKAERYPKKQFGC
jgi:hypothetical protein